jgi:hypothetical protein
MSKPKKDQKTEATANPTELARERLAGQIAQLKKHIWPEGNINKPNPAAKPEDLEQYSALEEQLAQLEKGTGAEKPQETPAPAKPQIEELVRPDTFATPPASERGLEIGEKPRIESIGHGVSLNVNGRQLEKTYYRH